MRYFLLPLLLLLVVTSSSAIFRAKVFVRLLCYHHPSSLRSNGLPCDTDNPCDPQFVFCFRNTTHRGTCNLLRVSREFRDVTQLGDCLRNASNASSILLEVPLTTERPDLMLELSINDVDGAFSMFQRFDLIDRLSFRLLPSDLPSLAHGRTPRRSDFTTIPALSRNLKGPSQPRVEVGAVLQCSEGHYGPLCGLECTASDQFGCTNNGSRLCRPGWTGLNCSQRDYCASRPCKDWAVCRSLKDGAECSCDGATGPQCRRDGDPCLRHRCANGASCLGVSGRPVCMCPIGWRGRLCDERDLCSPNPCGRGASCRQVGRKLFCDCSPGWRGPLCNLTRPVTALPPAGQPGDNERPFPTVAVLLLVIFGVIVAAALAVAAGCLWRRRHDDKTDADAKYPSLSSPPSQRPSLSTNPYDQERLSSDVRSSGQEAAYDTPGLLYSVREEQTQEEEDPGEDTAFQSDVQSPDRPRLPSGSDRTDVVRA